MMTLFVLISCLFLILTIPTVLVFLVLKRLNKCTFRSFVLISFVVSALAVPLPFGILYVMEYEDQEKNKNSEKYATSERKGELLMNPSDGFGVYIPFVLVMGGIGSLVACSIWRLQKPSKK